MAKVNLVNKKVRMDLVDIIKYQLVTHCYINKISVTKSDLDCLVLLSLSGESDINEFSILAFQKDIFKSTQSVRNCLVKLEKCNLVLKKSKKVIYLDPTINIQSVGNILLDYKIVHLATT